MTNSVYGFLQCDDENCKKMKSTLLHLQGCKKCCRCQNANCFTSRKLLEHWRSCVNINCFICSPIRPIVTLFLRNLFVNENVRTFVTRRFMWLIQFIVPVRHVFVM